MGVESTYGQDEDKTLEKEDEKSKFTKPNKKSKKRLCQKTWSYEVGKQHKTAADRDGREKHISARVLGSSPL